MTENYESFAPCKIVVNIEMKTSFFRDNLAAILFESNDTCVGCILLNWKYILVFWHQIEKSSIKTINNLNILLAKREEGEK